ncbi:MAG: hypothetical protein ACI9XC_001312 [Gammaproteobacteria bacterium]|jgi:hypothetical protein
MKIRNQTCNRYNIIALIFCLIISFEVNAHEYTNLNEVMIDRTNESIEKSLLQIQSFLTEIFRKSYKPETWPDRKITLLRNDLMHKKDEANMNLDYFAANGINLQSPEILFENPLAGRSVAGNQGVEIVYALLKHMDTLESQDEFIKEIYSSGLSGHMYNLVTAYREKMSLYRAIFITMPGPGQQIISEQKPVPIVESSDQNTNIIYVIIGVVLCVLLIGIFRRKRPISQNH